MSDLITFDVGFLLLQAIIQVFLIIFTVLMTLCLNNYYKRRNVIKGLRLEIIRNLKRTHNLKIECEQILSKHETDTLYHLVPVDFVDFSKKECEVNGYFNNINKNLVFDIDELYLLFGKLKEQVIQFNNLINSQHMDGFDVSINQKGVLLNIQFDIYDIAKILKSKHIIEFLESVQIDFNPFIT